MHGVVTVIDVSLLGVQHKTTVVRALTCNFDLNLQSIIENEK